MKLNLVLIVLVYLICLSMARHHNRSNEYFRHHKSSLSRAKATTRALLRTTSRNMRIRADLKNMGMLGMATPEENPDNEESKYNEGYDERIAE